MVKRGNVKDLDIILKRKNINKNQKINVFSTLTGQTISTIFSWIIGIIGILGGFLLIYASWGEMISVLIGFSIIIFGFLTILINRYINRRIKEQDGKV